MPDRDPDTIRALVAAEKERRRRLVEMKEAAEAHRLDFIRMFWSVIEPARPLVEGWVLDAICDVLESVTDGFISRAIINVPPGSGKSLILNVFWPAWEWGPCDLPSLRYLSASYNEKLPERDNGRFAKLIRDPLYQRCWGSRVTLLRESLSLVENVATGWKRTTSTHSGTTGHRGDRILIDDANDPNNVESDAVRESTVHWLREVMPDRLNSLEDGVIINLQQRTHEEDATGVLAKYGGDYSWLMVPMEFDPLRATPVVLRWDDDGTPTKIWRDPRGLDAKGIELPGIGTDRNGRRLVLAGSPMADAEGTLAWPERFPAEAIERLKTIKGPYAWASQYQQSPTVRGGEIIRNDWWLPWTSASFPEMGTVIASLDTAMELGDEADYNALTVWGAWSGPSGEPRLMLLAAWRDRLPLAQLVARVAETCGKHRVDYRVVEHKTRGRDVHDEIRRQYATAAWQTILWKVSGDKRSRLEAVAPLFSGDVRRDPMTGLDVWSGGLIYAPDRAWADEVIEQVASFPRGAHDDYVDSVSMALAFIRQNGVVLRKVEWEAEELDAKVYRRPPSVPYVI